ncbi:MAG: sugar MFS transporter [Flavobacteriales bacterium]
MASVGGAGDAQFRTSIDPGNKYTGTLALMFALFFMIGFITVMNDVLIPSLKAVFEFTEADTAKLMLIQFCFFAAYGIMSIPSGKILQRVGYKKGLAISLAVVATGLLLFLPAASLISYPFFLFALFIVGSGLALLQVALNPYISVLGSAETAASRLNLGGALNSTATFIGPIIGGSIILSDCLPDIQSKVDAVQMPYIVLSVVTFLIAGILYKSNLPVIEGHSGADVVLEGSAWRFSHLRKGAFSIFFYVGVEVAIGSLLILYLKEPEMGGIEEKLAASLLAYYWGSAMVGRFIGSYVARKMPAGRLIVIVSAVALILVVLSMLPVFMDSFMDINVLSMGSNCKTGEFELGFKNVHVPVAAFLLVLVGLFNSVMWPSIFPLGINRLGKYTSSGSGFMVTMVLGGAVIPVVQGFVAKGLKIGQDAAGHEEHLFGFDGFGFKISFLLSLVCYAYILYFGWKGHKVNEEELKAAGLQ